jgi:hypothetical protein
MPATHRKTDASHFSPLANVQTPKTRIPPCKTCGKESLGGCVVEMGKSAPVGMPIMTAEFYCGEHAPSTFGMMSYRLFPAWRILSVEEPWRLKLQRLDRERQEERVRR